MKPARACPICPQCGSKKFKRIGDDNVQVQCLKCKKIIVL